MPVRVVAILAFALASMSVAAASAGRRFVVCGAVGRPSSYAQETRIGRFEE